MKNTQSNTESPGQMTFFDNKGQAIDIAALESAKGFEKLYRIPAVYYKSWLEKHGGTFSGKDVLDFGCGEGVPTTGLSLFCDAATVLGVDIGDDFTCARESLHEISPDLECPANVRFAKVAPAESLGESVFDVIVSWSVLEHVSQDIFDEQVAVLVRSLRPGGFCVFQIAPLFYSAFGSHLFDTQAPWEHLTCQANLLRGKVISRHGDSALAENQWNCFVTLNKFTAENFLERLRLSGLRVLDTYETSVNQIPNDQLLSVFSRDVLTKEQILVVCTKDAVKPARIDAQSTYADISFAEDLSALLAPSPLDGRFPPADKTAKKLIVLHTGRCGSTLLHHLLIKENLCPPFELSNPDAARSFLQEIKGAPPIPAADYFFEYRKLILGESIDEPKTVISFSFTPWNLLGVFSQSPALVEWLFDGAYVLVLLRRNIFQQALSYKAATQTGKWHSSDIVPADFEPSTRNDLEISNFLDLIIWGETALSRPPFKNLLEKCHYQSIASYETFIENPNRLLARILQSLGMEQLSTTALDAEDIPKQLPAKEKAYQELRAQLPIVLPSGFIVDESFFSQRLKESW